MRYNVNLDTGAVSANTAIIKAGGRIATEIVFLKSNIPQTIGSPWAIEYIVRKSGELSGYPLISHNDFAIGSGSVYRADVNGTLPAMLDALGIGAGDSNTANDKPSIIGDVEISWSVDGKRFPSVNFSLQIQAPRGPVTVIAAPNPATWGDPLDYIRADQSGSFLIASANGTIWQVFVNNDGTFSSVATYLATGTSTLPELVTPNGTTRRIAINDDGSLYSYIP